MIKIAVVAALIVAVIAGSFFVADSYAEKKKKKDCDSNQNRLKLDLQSGNQKIEDEKVKAELEFKTIENSYKAQQRDIPKQTRKDLENKIKEAEDRVGEAKSATKDVGCSNLEKAKKAFVKRADRAYKAIEALTDIDRTLGVLEDSIRERGQSENSKKDKKTLKEDNKRATESLERALTQLKNKAGFSDSDLEGDDNSVVASPNPSASSSVTASPTPIASPAQ